MVHRNDLFAFHALLARITAPDRRPPRILALCGAGLSAASGLPTFRGATGALWETHDPMTLATPEAFRRDPVLVWRFYAHRRSVALHARPNAGHRALAALARNCPGFLCLTQNVDGLSPRAGHPPAQLQTLHGSLFDLRCARAGCGYVERDNRQEPLWAATTADDDDILSVLPRCPACRDRGRSSLLRPGVVWFGEALDKAMVDEVDTWIDAGKIDLMLVVGTSAEVYPAAGYVDVAREEGAVVASVNLDAADLGCLSGMQPEDFAFGGDAAQLLPRMLEPLIGELSQTGEWLEAKEDS